jgi:hypothetical protein
MSVTLIHRSEADYIFIKISEYLESNKYDTWEEYYDAEGIDASPERRAIDAYITKIYENNYHNLTFTFAEIDELEEITKKIKQEEHNNKIKIKKLHEFGLTDEIRKIVLEKDRYRDQVMKPLFKLLEFLTNHPIYRARKTRAKKTRDSFLKKVIKRQEYKPPNGEFPGGKAYLEAAAQYNRDLYNLMTHPMPSNGSRKSRKSRNSHKSPNSHNTSKSRKSHNTSKSRKSRKE